jgi:hypothetical protein
VRTLTAILVSMILAACSAAAPKPTVVDRRQALEIADFLASIDATPVPVNFPKFDTMEEAAIAALKNIVDKAPVALQGYEWGGVIGKTEAGKYVYSQPDTDYQGDNVHLAGGLPPDAVNVAGYHTHPCLPEHEVEYFSPEDLIPVLFSRKPATFMGDYCTGNVHEFKEGDKPDAVKVLGQVYLTKGRIIGQFTTPHAMPKEGI